MFFSKSRNLVKALVGIVVVILLTLLYILMVGGKGRSENLNIKCNDYSSEGEYSGVNIQTNLSIQEIKNISVENNSFDALILASFEWNGEEGGFLSDSIVIKNGEINSMRLMHSRKDASKLTEVYLIDATISKSFDIARFPFDEHMLQIDIMLTYDINKVRLVSNNDKMKLSNDIIDNNNWEFLSGTVKTTYNDYTELGDGANPLKMSQISVGVGVKRNAGGLLVILTIIFGVVIIWVFMMMFLNIFKKIDPLSLMPISLVLIALNIVINILASNSACLMTIPMKLNIIGIVASILSMGIVLVVNDMRNNNDDKADSKMFGKIMYCILAISTVIEIVLTLV